MSIEQPFYNTSGCVFVERDTHIHGARELERAHEPYNHYLVPILPSALWT